MKEHPLTTMVLAYAHQHNVNGAIAKQAVLATAEGAAAAKGTTDDPAPKARLGRLVAAYMDTHGVGRTEATRAVLATAEGAAIDALIPKKAPPPRPTVDERIRKCLAAKWEIYDPNAALPEFKIRLSMTPDFVIAYVDGMPPRLLGVALHGRPPIVLVKEGLIPVDRHRVLAHEIAHIIFDGHGRDDDSEDVKEMRAERFARFLCSEMAPLDPMTGRPVKSY